MEDGRRRLGQAATPPPLSYSLGVWGKVFPLWRPPYSSQKGGEEGTLISDIQDTRC